MKKKFDVMGRIRRALESFSVSYAFVIIIYVVISNLGIFDPIDNEMAVQLMCICLVIAVIHFALGFVEMKTDTTLFFSYFVVVIAVVLFMGLFVYDFFEINISFFICLAVMLILVFSGTFMIAFFSDWKKAREINEIIRQKKK